VNKSDASADAVQVGIGHGLGSAGKVK
jgi:hypothetical protein